MAVKKIKSITRTLTKKQWDKFLPVRKLAVNLRLIASSLDALPSDVRGKITLQVEIGRPTKGHSPNAGPRRL